MGIGRTKLTPVVTNKWSSGWLRNWFYYRVPSQKADVCGKGTYLLRSEMNPLDYLTDAPHACIVDDVNVLAFKEAAVIIGGIDAVKEFLACRIWLLSDDWQANLKFVMGKLMLTVDALHKIDQPCVDLHNYYINNYKLDQDIIVSYKDGYFPVGDGFFVISLSDLHLFNLDVLDVSLMRCFAL
jgi:hypothetical protein